MLRGYSYVFCRPFPKSNPGYGSGLFLVIFLKNLLILSLYSFIIWCLYIWLKNVYYVWIHVSIFGRRMLFEYIVRRCFIQKVTLISFVKKLSFVILKELECVSTLIFFNKFTLVTKLEFFTKTRSNSFNITKLYFFHKWY